MDLPLSLVERGSDAAYLTRRESQVFELLFARRTRPVTVSEIIGRMTDDEDDKTILPTTVWSYISALRKKLMPLGLEIRSRGQERYTLHDMRLEAAAA